MIQRWQDWPQAFAQTLRDPQKMAVEVLQHGFGRPELIQMVVVLAIANVMTIACASALTTVNVPTDAVLMTPVPLAILLAVCMVFLGSALFRAGAFFGGHGTFSQSLMLVIWIQSIGLTFDIGQILLLMISPELAALLGIGALIAIVYCMVNFVQVLHGFSGLGLSLGVFFIAMTATIFIAVILMGIMGFTPTGVET